MSQVLRRPLLHHFGYPSSSSSRTPIHFSSRRCFSHIQPLRIMLAARNLLPKAPRVQTTPSLATLKRKELEDSAAKQLWYKSDFGLFEDTFIYPIGSAPSLFTRPKAFLRLQYRWLKSRVMDYISLCAVKMQSPPTDKGARRFLSREFKIARTLVAPAAVDLHREMYTAFAAGRSDTLRNKCCEGLRDNLLQKISLRPTGETMHWEVVKYNSKAQVLSSRALLIPDKPEFPVPKGAGLRQAVVRIRSRQKLTRKKGKKVLDQKEKNVDELFVIQRRTDGDFPWMIWGTLPSHTARSHMSRRKPK